MKIEFFHDVICSFCFPMSYQMRELQKRRPDIEIVHRSFALVKEVEAFDTMFGSREAAKMEIMSHWQHANKIDEEHRFNIEGMKDKTFLFPSSMNGLMAVMAAKRMADDETYWKLFDGLQEALFVDNKNIESIDVIEGIINQIGLDLVTWRRFFEDPVTKERVLADLELARVYQISSVPSLVIDETYQISGARSVAHLLSAIERIEEKNSPQSIENNQMDGEACRLENGTFTCD